MDAESQDPNFWHYLSVKSLGNLSRKPYIGVEDENLKLSLKMKVNNILYQHLTASVVTTVHCCPSVVNVKLSM